IKKFVTPEDIATLVTHFGPPPPGHKLVYCPSVLSWNGAKGLWVGIWPEEQETPQLQVFESLEPREVPLRDTVATPMPTGSSMPVASGGDGVDTDGEDPAAGADEIPDSEMASFAQFLSSCEPNQELSSWIMLDADSASDDDEVVIDEKGKSDDEALLALAAAAPHVPPKKRELKASVRERKSVAKGEGTAERKKKGKGKAASKGKGKNIPSRKASTKTTPKKATDPALPRNGEHSSLGTLYVTYATACSYICYKDASRKPRLVVQIGSSMSSNHAKLIAQCLKYMCTQGCSKEQVVAYRNKLIKK
ncbi:unnamed protein product, partial [Prorocentrum cordatum]